MKYQSTVEYASTTCPGVRFRVRRMSLGRRIELGKRIREIGLRGEYLAAGQALEDQIEASVLEHQIHRTYLEWGLSAVEGLCIDGAPAGPVETIEQGPEELAQEILQAVRTELHLTEAERKN